MALESFSLDVINAYGSLISTLPEGFRSFANLFFVVLMMVFYSIFVWKLHILIGKKNILNLNLKQYNSADHPVAERVISTLLYFAEYIIIMPILIFFWFAVFTFFLILVLELDLKIILFISAATIATIRITSYIPKYGHGLSREIAKLIPFNLLAIALITPGFFDVGRIIGNLTKLDAFFGLIVNYLVFILILEVLLRFFEYVFLLFGIEDEDEEKDED